MNKGINVHLDMDKLFVFASEVQGKIVANVIRLVSIMLYRNTVKESPVDSGRMRGSIKPPKKESDTKYSIEIGAEYWKFVQFGTGIHGPKGETYSIYPIKSNVLHWVSGGKDIFARYVEAHPGQKANPFIDRAIDKIDEKALDTIVEQVLKGIEK